MKVHIPIFLLILWISSPVYSQDTLRNESKDIESIAVIEREITLVNDLTFRQSDTTYYKDGKVKNISVYPKRRNKIGNNLISGFELQKKVLQYDKCGNLRNITKLSRYTGQIESCHDYYFNHPYQIEDNIIENVDCDELWIKSLLIY